ncbi:MAG: hypothetical protein HY821_07865 [Acidobacteria bacterium]|nr:hypothetical protein [Acidobacteriota bacterium]
MKISVVFGLALALAASTSAQVTNTTIVVTPSSLPPVPTATGVANDSAPGFPLDSWAHNGGGTKSEFYITPAALFGGRTITLGDIARISYWTKTPFTHGTDPRDWYLAIYSNPYPGDVSTPSWYGVRIGSEPYFSANVSDPANTWNQWSTDGASNKLRFFESTAGAPGANFGSYTDPDWAAFAAGNALGSGVPYAGLSILTFSVQTGSAWSAGFTGQLDGLRIELTDGSVARVNFEAMNHIPSSKDQCKGEGWKSLYRADFSAFKNQGDCVQYVNTGK